MQMRLSITCAALVACVTGGGASAETSSPAARYQHDVSCAANTSALLEFRRQEAAPTAKQQARYAKMYGQVTGMAQRSGAAVGKTGGQVSAAIAAERARLIAAVPSNAAAAKNYKGDIGLTAMSCAFASLENEMGKTK